MLQGNAFLGRGNRDGALRVWAKALAASQGCRNGARCSISMGRWSVRARGPSQYEECFVIIAPLVISGLLKGGRRSL